MPKSTILCLILKLSFLVGYLLFSNIMLYETIVVNIYGKKSTLILFYSLYVCGFFTLFLYFSFSSNGILKITAFFLFIVSGISGQYYWTVTGFPITIDALEIALINMDGLASLLAEKPHSMAISLGTAAIGVLGILFPTEWTPLPHPPPCPACGRRRIEIHIHPASHQQIQPGRCPTLQ